MKSHLLPEGFRDSLPELAKKEFLIVSKFVNFMLKNNYNFVKPPLAEFENSLFFLTKNIRNNNSFRVLDPISQKMMGLRSDMTSQIARIASSSLKKKSRPLRISYFGEILKVKNNQLNISRQFTQIGAELIGIRNSKDEVELINLLILILEILNIKNFSIVFSMPTLINSLCKDYKLNDQQISFLKQKFENKNIIGLNKISKSLEKDSEILFKCIGNLSSNLKELKKYSFKKNTKTHIEVFIKSILFIKKKLSHIDLNIDPIEVDEFGYHDGITFKVYSDKFNELFNGGKYKVNNEDSIGFSGIVENLIEECALKLNKKKILVSASISNIDRIKLINKGFTIISSSSFSKLESIKKIAKKNECNFIFYNKKILRECNE